MFLVGFFPQQVGFFALVLALSAGVVEWRRGNRFFRLFLPLSLGCLLGYLGIMLVYHIYLDDLAQAFARLRYMVWPDFVLWKLEATVLPAAFVAMCVSLVEQEMRLRLELSLLEERNEMAEASYKNLQSQSEQVMMLRHDMTKHMTLLRSMIGDKSPQAVDYLDELIGQEKAIRSVAVSYTHLDVYKRQIQNNEEELAAGTAAVNVPDIRTGDEVELLADSFRRMEEDMILSLIHICGAEDNAHRQDHDHNFLPWGKKLWS